MPTAFTPAADAPAYQARARAILLVDDEPQFREMLAEYLVGESFEVLEAGSGEEALPQAPSWRPDLVLLDLMMAGIGGLETLRRIKIMQPDTCVIMVTAVDDLDVARSALTAGAADYVTKPFTFDYLDAVLDIHVPSDRTDLDVDGVEEHPSCNALGALLGILLERREGSSCEAAPEVRAARRTSRTLSARTRAPTKQMGPIGAQA